MKIAVSYTGFDHANYRIPKSRILDTENRNDLSWLIYVCTGKGVSYEQARDCVFYDLGLLDTTTVVQYINNIVAQTAKEKVKNQHSDKLEKYYLLKKELGL